MDIEKAKEILNESVISEPSIKSYMYISAKDINQAIEIILKKLEEKEIEIETLKEIITEQKNKENQKYFKCTLLDKVGRKIILGKNNTVLE